MTPETTAQWQQLARVALHAGKLAIAERCYAAVGNIAKAHYLHQVRAVCYLTGTLLSAVVHVVDAGCRLYMLTYCSLKDKCSRLEGITLAAAEETWQAMLFAVKPYSLCILALD